MRAEAMVARLDKAIVRSGMTLDEVCIKAEVTEDFLRNLRRGGSNHPSFFHMCRLAALLHVSPFWLSLQSDDPQESAIPELPPRKF